MSTVFLISCCILFISSCSQTVQSTWVILNWWWNCLNWLEDCRSEMSSVGKCWSWVVLQASCLLYRTASVIRSTFQFLLSASHINLFRIICSKKVQSPSSRMNFICLCGFVTHFYILLSTFPFTANSLSIFLDTFCHHFSVPVSLCDEWSFFC